MLVCRGACVPQPTGIQVEGLLLGHDSGGSEEPCLGEVQGRADGPTTVPLSQGGPVRKSASNSDLSTA